MPRRSCRSLIELRSSTGKLVKAPRYRPLPPPSGKGAQLRIKGRTLTRGERALLACGLTWEEAAQRCAMSSGYLRTILREGTHVLFTARRVAGVLHMNANDLMPWNVRSQRAKYLSTKGDDQTT